MIRAWTDLTAFRDRVLASQWASTLPCWLMTMMIERVLWSLCVPKGPGRGRNSLTRIRCVPFVG